MMDGDELESAEGRRIVNLRKVEAGTHQIRVEKEGYRFFSQSIEVPTDEWVQVQAVLYKEVIAAPVPPTPAEASDEGNQVLSAEIVNGVQKASGASLEGKEQSLEEESPVDGASLGSGKAGAAMAAPLKGGPDPRDGGTRVQAKPGPTSSGLNSSIEYCAECPVAPVEELVKSPGGEPVGVFVAPVGETAGLSKDVGYSERASAGVSAAASEIEDDARLAGEGGEVLAKDRVRARPGSSKALGWRRYSSTSGGGVSNSGAGVPSKADKVEARTGGSVEAEDGEDAAVDPIPYEPRFLNSKAQASSGSGTPGQARAAGEASSRFEGAKPEPVVAAPIPPPP
jgi:hypothetical protein